MSIAIDEAARGPTSNGGGGIAKVDGVMPDPTPATVQMLLREIGALKELIDANKVARDHEMIHQKELCWSRFDTAEREAARVKELLETRVHAVEQGIKIAHENEARWPTVLDREVTAVKEFYAVKLDTVNERFISVNRRFDERDKRHDDNTRDAKVAVDAAFKAAHEAVNLQRDASERAITKQEAAFTKQLESSSIALNTAKVELDRRLDDAKERMNGMSNGMTTQLNQLQQTITGIQAAQTGRKELTNEKNDNATYVYGAIGVLIGLGGLVAAFLARTAS